MSVMARMTVSMSPLFTRATNSSRVILPGVEVLMRPLEPQSGNGSRGESEFLSDSCAERFASQRTARAVLPNESRHACGASQPRCSWFSRACELSVRFFTSRLLMAGSRPMLTRGAATL